MPENTEEILPEDEERRLTEAEICAALEVLAEQPRTSFERWVTYRETDLESGRAVYWLMKAGQESLPITACTLPDGTTLSHEIRYYLLQRVLDHYPPKGVAVAFVAHSVEQPQATP